MLRRRAFGLGLGLTAAIVAAGGVLVQADPVTILWDSATGERGTIGATPVDWAQLLIDTFNKQYPDIKVEHNYDETEPYLLQIASGGGPDVIVDCCDDLINSARAGTYLPLNQFFGNKLPDYPAQKVFYPAQWNVFQVKGQQFGLPQYLGTDAMFANRQMFDAAGVDIPSADLATNTQNWADFEAMCKKLTLVDASGKITQYGFTKDLGSEHQSMWLLGAGAQFYVNGDTSKSGLASPQAVQTFSFLQRMHNQDQCMGLTSDLFDNGHAATVEYGPWDLHYFLGATADGKAKKPWNISIFPMPIGPAGVRGDKFTYDGIEVSAKTKHLDAALKFAQFLASKQAEEIRAKLIGLQPARADVAPEYISLMESLNTEAYTVGIHVFTDAATYAQAPWIYSDMKVAEPMLEGAAKQIIENDAPVQSTWYPTVAALNNVLASEK